MTIVENKIPDISNLVKKKTDFDDKDALNKTKYAFIVKQFSYLNGKSYFDEDGKQNYLVFLPMKKYFKLSLVTGVIDPGDPKEYLMKVLSHLQHLIVALFHH